MIVVREDIHAALTFISVGFLLMVLPWIADRLGGEPLETKVLFVGAGVAGISLGLWRWRTAPVCLVVDRQGLWVSSRRWEGLLIIPWSELLGVESVGWRDGNGDHEGLLVGLSPHALAHVPNEQMAQEKRSLEDRFGPIEWPNVLLLGNDAWHWSPVVVANVIDACRRDPAKAERLPEYTDRM